MEGYGVGTVFDNATSAMTFGGEFDGGFREKQGNATQNRGNHDDGMVWVGGCERADRENVCVSE